MKLNAIGTQQTVYNGFEVLNINRSFPLEIEQFAIPESLSNVMSFICRCFINHISDSTPNTQHVNMYRKLSNPKQL